MSVKVTQKVVKEVEIVTDFETAQALKTLFRHVGGPQSGPRGLIEKFSDELEDAGVFRDDSHLTSGSIYFGEGGDEGKPQKFSYGQIALINNMIAAVNRGLKIEAIKDYRQLTGLGLKEAKDAIENLNRKPLI